MPKSRTREVFAVVAAALLTAAPALADDQYLGLEYARGIGLPEVDIRLWAVGIIRAFMGLLGLILVMQIMWGGFLLMTHGGSEEAHKKAVSTIHGAVIGMILIASSASLAKFVVDAIMKATGNYS